MAWSTSDRRERLPADWVQLRAQVFELHGRQCYVVEDGIQCVEESSDIDHVVAGDDHSLDNLRPICRRHHRRKSSSEGWHALRKKKAEARERSMKRFGHEEAHPGANPEKPFRHPWQ